VACDSTRGAHGSTAVALLKSHSLPRWQSLLFLIGVLLIGTPDGVEIINLFAALLLALAFVPYGTQIIRGAHPRASAHDEQSVTKDVGSRWEA
jgi:hypothetical protein